MDFAQEVINHPGKIVQRDIDLLRSYYLADEQILDIVVVSTARNFFSKTLDALDVRPDETYLDLETELIQTLTIGRPIS